MTQLLRTEWYCPNCRTSAYLPPLRARQTHFHTCPRLSGLSAPLLPAGVRAKVEAREREDYVGTEAVQVDDSGRAIMSVVTTRDNGQDTAVLAPVARVKVGSS